MTEIVHIFFAHKGKEPFARPFLIAGPCSAVAEEQVVETALRLA